MYMQRCIIKITKYFTSILFSYSSVSVDFFKLNSLALNRGYKIKKNQVIVLKI